MSTIKFSYFDARGRGEVARYMLELGNSGYVDDRFTWDEYLVRKANGDFAANFGRIPVLSYNGHQFGQSKAIERFLAKKYGFFGSNEIEEFQVDVITEHWREVKDKYIAVRDGKSGDELAKAKADFVANDLPGFFKNIESSYAPGGGYAVGNKLSLADLYSFNLAFEYIDPALTKEVDALVDQYPAIKASAHLAKDALAEYLARRKVTPW